MQKFVDAEYDHKPNDIEIYKSGVDVITKCVETQKKEEQLDITRTVWICDVERYSLLEYIYAQQSKYDALNKQLTQTQVGLTEVYEMLLSTSDSKGG